MSVIRKKYWTTGDKIASIPKRDQDEGLNLLSFRLSPEDILVLTERRNLMNRTRTVVIGALMLALSFPVVGSAQDRKADPDLVRARQLFFGAENVDPRSGRVRHDKVIFSWFTNSSYAVSLKGPDNPAGLLRPSSGDCT